MCSKCAVLVCHSNIQSITYNIFIEEIWRKLNGLWYFEREWKWEYNSNEY